MRSSLIAFLIAIALIFAVSVVNPEVTAYAAKASNPKITGHHEGTKYIFSPNGDGAAEDVTISSTITCPSAGGTNRAIIAIRSVKLNAKDCSPNNLDIVRFSYVTEMCVLGKECKFSRSIKWKGEDTAQLPLPDGTYCIQVGCGQTPEIGFEAKKIVAVELNRNAWLSNEAYDGEECGKVTECKPGKFAGAMNSCKKILKPQYCKKEYICKTKEIKSDCRFDGWKCNTGQGDYCCNKVIKRGTCIAPTPTPK